MDDIGSGSKRSPNERISSTNSRAVSTPSPIKRLQALRERLLAGIDDWKYERQTKCQTPKVLSPMCSPNFHAQNIPEPHIFAEPLHFHDFNSHLCDTFHNNCPPEGVYDLNPPHFSTNCLRSPSKPTNIPTERKSEFRNCDMKSPKCDDQIMTARNKLYRAKSCPKDLFSVSSKCSDNEIRSGNENEDGNRRQQQFEQQHNHERHDNQHQHHHQSHHQIHHESRHQIHQHENENMKSRNESAESNWLRPPCREDFTPCYSDDFVSPSHSRQQNSRQQNFRMKNIPKIKVHKPKSKTPNSMDEFIASKLVRGNLAASLRQKNSRQKINELSEEKLKATMDVSKFIPKCHHWNVRDSPGWKNFITEE